MPLIQTRGAASAQGFGEFAQASGPANYIEDVFSTYLYTGNGSTQTITNGIDLSTKGGLVWSKCRNTTGDHEVVDTVRGASKGIYTNTTGAQVTNADVNGFTTSGYTLGYTTGYANVNGNTYASWTFRKQPKFFDIVTYTGNDAASRNIAHNLGSTPGCIIIKNTSYSGAQAWVVWHRTQNDKYLQLWKTDAVATDGGSFYPSLPTSTNFTIGPAGAVNDSASNYVAYLFAHDAGGFGLTGTDNVISCGSYTGNGLTAGPEVTLGYEPQWVMVKRSNSTGDWQIVDVMRPMSETQTNTLFPNLSSAEDVGSSGFPTIVPTATGFKLTNSGSGFNASGGNYIYIAIRRGPMKVPTLGTSVYMGATRTGNGAVTALTAAGFPPDLYWAKSTAGVRDHAIFDRLRGPLPLLSSNNTQNEIAYTDDLKSFNMTGVTTGTDGSTNAYNQNGVAYVNWYMRRAPSFFDEVCYTGDGTTSRNVTHNLTVQPELVVVKSRSNGSTNWVTGVYANATQSNLWLNSTAADGSASSGGITYTQFSTSASFRLSAVGGIVTDINTTSATYVAYLFATCAGVSKVGSYTGNGTTQTINCGFGAGGARFVLIKRTDSTGNWYVYDTARGMTVLTDPYLFLNSDTAETATLGSVTTVSTGFALNSAILAAINVSAGTYIFLAIA